ncbi:FecR family protein [Methylobacterium sp. JK268]
MTRRRPAAASPARDDLPVEAAIGWMVELSSGAVTDQQRRAFEGWIGADPRHEAAWLQLQEGLMPLGVAARQDLPRGALTAHLAGRRRPDRRSVLAGLAAALGLGTAGALVADRFVPLGHLLADHVTRTGEQESVRLADGSEAVLGPRTALDVDYAAGRRALRLIEGEVLLRVAARSAPFRLDAGPLSLEAGSGRFLVERRADLLAATGLDGVAEIALDAGGRVPLGRGERVALERGGFRRQAVDPDDATAWLDGLLVAKNRSVASIVRALRPYFPGMIRLDPAVAEIRVTGVLPLRRPHEALEILAASQNLSMTSVAHYWVAIGPGEGADAPPA